MTGPTASTVRRVADQLLVALAAVDPTAAGAARTANLAGVPAELPLLSSFAPDDVDHRIEAHRQVLQQLSVVQPRDAGEADLAAALHERATAEIALHAVGFGAEQLAPLATAPHQLRGEVGRAVDAAIAGGGPDGSAPGTVAAQVLWDRVVAAMQALPSALDAHAATLLRASHHQRGSSRRQVLTVAAQCADWLDPAGSDWFRSQIGRAPLLERERVGAAVERAMTGVRRYRAFLVDDLAPSAADIDAVGPDVYTVTAGAYLGDAVDPYELARWGVDELDRITAEMQQVARSIHPDGPVAAAAVLDADPNRLLHTRTQIVQWLERGLQDAAQVLDGTFVHLPQRHPLPRCRVTDSGAGVMYYEPADVAGALPGTVWWAQEPDRPVHTWRERSTVHHEGVPGHHLQITLAAQSPDLHAWQRFCCHVHGHAEGWAHHAESWVGEIGLLDDPADRLGMLQAQAWRAARIVIDTGLHLGLRPPAGALDGDPQHWSIASAREYLQRISGLGPVAAGFEVDRYLGWPGQALAFRVGARLFDAILAEARLEPGFQEAAFRTSLLRRGPMGLGPLRGRVLGS